MPKTYFSNGLTAHGYFRWLMTFCQVTVLAEIGLSKQYATQTIEELTERCAARKMVKFRLR